jgi:hypothetical protein
MMTRRTTANDANNKASVVSVTMMRRRLVPGAQKRRRTQALPMLTQGDSGCSSLWSKKNYTTINHQVVVELEEEEEAMSVSIVYVMENEGGAQRIGVARTPPMARRSVGMTNNNEQRH